MNTNFEYWLAFNFLWSAALLYVSTHLYLIGRRLKADRKRYGDYLRKLDSDQRKERQI